MSYGTHMLRELGGAYGTYRRGKFWVVATLISLLSVFLLAGTAINGLPQDQDFWFVVAVLILAIPGAFVFPLACWQRVATKRFFKWLEFEWGNLETGAIHPDGYTVTFDTPLVQYKLVISALLASVTLASKPYVQQHRSAGFVQASFTILTLLFGWCYLGLEGVVNSVEAIYGNLRSSHTITLREVIMKAQKCN